MHRYAKKDPHISIAHHSSLTSSPPTHHYDSPKHLRTDLNTSTPSASALTSALPTHSARPIERIFRERSCKRLLAADLLAANKRVHGNGNGAVNVCAATVFC